MNRLTEPKGIGVMIAGGACPATSLVGHEVIQLHHRVGGNVYILRNGLNALLEGTAPEIMRRNRESYVSDLLGEASRDYVGKENAQVCAHNLATLSTNYGIQLLHVVGGDGTAAGLHSILTAYKGANKPSVSLAPKTIDGDVLHTDTTIGHKTAVSKIDEMMRAFRHDSLKMKRILFVQVPGRDAGHLALQGGEGHADIILIKERPFHQDEISQKAQEIYIQQGYCVISVAEGFEPIGINPNEFKSIDPQGNNGNIAIASYLATKTKEFMWEIIKEADAKGKKPVNHCMIPSEILRGATPVHEDRELATNIGVEMFNYNQRANGQYELAFVVQNNRILPIPLERIALGIKTVKEKDYREGMYINHNKRPIM